MKSQDPSISLLLGLPFHAINMSAAIKDCENALANKEPAYIVTPNLDFVAQAYNDDDLRNILFYAYRVVCDGKPLLWMSKFFKAPLPERVAGSDMVFHLFESCAQHGYSVYFFGSDDKTLTTTSRKLNEKFPTLKICGHQSPPMANPINWDNKKIVTSIQEAKPDLLLVALGCPKQERWIYEHYRSLNIPLCIGIGASLDFISGKQVRAPEWMQSVGLEWFWRMAHHPSRLISRYSKDLFYLIYLSYKQWSALRECHASNKLRSTASESLITEAIETVKWKGSVEHANLQAHLLPSTYEKHIVCDCSEITFIDSGGFGRLATIARKAHAASKAFCLLNPSASVKKLISAMRLEKQMPMFATVEKMHDYINQFSETFIKVQRDPEFNCLTLTPLFDLDAEHIHSLEDAIERSLVDLPINTKIYIDIASISFIDSTAIGTIARLKKQCRERGYSLWLEKPTDTVRKTLEILQLNTVLIKES